MLYILLLLSIPFVVIAQHAKPNIIYIYADDMGYGELGSYGQQKIKTPYLDKMAVDGMRFTQHYTSSPVCAPARAMLMTGKHAGHAYIRGNYELGGFEDENEGGQMPLPEGTFTIAKMLQQAGYTTAMIGKWGLGMHNSTGNPKQQGFDYYYGYLDQKQAHNFYPTHLWENGKWDSLNNPYFFVHRSIPPNSPDTAFDDFKGIDYSLTKMSEKTLAFISSHLKAGQTSNTQPFFLYLPFTGPHVSLQAPDAAVKEYIGRFDEQPYYGEKGYAPSKYPYSTYAAMITYMDKQVGKIIALLKELKADSNTLIMFSSDNGSTFDVGGVNGSYFNLTGGLRGRKQDLYEGGIRVPFIAKWPGHIPAGKVSDVVSAQYDMMATLADLTGATPWPNDGVSFLPALFNQKIPSPHPFFYFEFPEKNGQIAIRMGDWKGVKSNMKNNKDAEWEIYNLKTDRGETTNLASLYPELAKQFEEIAKHQHQPAHIKEWEFVDPKFKK